MGEAIRSKCCNAPVTDGPGNKIAKENNNDSLLSIDNKTAQPDEVTKCRACGRLLSEDDTYKVETKSTVSVGLQSKTKKEPLSEVNGG